MPETSIKDKILSLFADAIPDIVFYERKNSEFVTVAEIDQAFLSGEVTVEDVLEVMQEELEEYVGILREEGGNADDME